MKHSTIALMAIVLAAVSTQAVGQEQLAADCSSYPVAEGLSIEEVAGGLKILSTARADVLIGDAGELQSALREAQLYAEAAIAEFMNKSIQSEDLLETAVSTAVNIKDGEKTAAQDRVKVQLRSIRTNASAVLSGVAPLSNCYTSGEFVLFTVGVKPEFIEGASGLKQDMEAAATADAGNGQDGASSNDQTSGSAQGEPVQPTTGFSNTSGLNNF